MKKKILGVLLIFLMVFAMAACGSKSNEAKTDESSNQTESTTSETPTYVDEDNGALIVEADQAGNSADGANLEVIGEE